MISFTKRNYSRLSKSKTCCKNSLLLIALLGILSLHTLQLDAQPDATNNENPATTENTADNPADTPEKEIAEVEDRKNEGFFSLILRGGWTMLGLFLISTIILAFSIERFLYFRRQKIDTRGFFDSLNSELDTGGLEGARKFLASDDRLIAGVISSGLRKSNMTAPEFERIVERRATIEIGKLERGLNLLANLGNIAPLLGFFGTVVGMRTSFLQFVIEKAPTAQDLAGGVEEALITTAAGLLVAIPTYLIYNLFIFQIDNFSMEIEQSTEIIHRSLED